MTELLAHAGAAPGEPLGSWQLVLIAILYLSLGAGLGVGILIGKRNQRGTAGTRSEARDNVTYPTRWTSPGA